MAVSRMRNKKYATQPSFMAESPKFSRLLGNRGRGTRGDVRCQTGNGNMAVLPMHSKIHNITLVIGTLLSLCSCYEAVNTFHSMCFQFDEKSSESALKSPKFRHLQGNRGQGIKRRCQNFYRNHLIRRLCACAVKTQLEVATNAAKSPKYQSLHAKFRTLLFLFTITVVDYGTYFTYLIFHI